MKSTQPNFEIVKTAFYQAFINSSEVSFSVLRETMVAGKLLGSFNTRLDTFKHDFNQWLDGLDIRSVGSIIEVLVKSGASIPAWIKGRQFSIDYNENGSLDLIRH